MCILNYDEMCNQYLSFFIMQMGIKLRAPEALREMDLPQELLEFLIIS